MKSLYALLLYLFPRAYREEYGGELQIVFNLSLDDAMQAGIFEVAGVVLRELIGLPKAIIHEHLRERRKMTGKLASRFDFEPGSRNETFAALAPFLLGGVLPVLFSLIVDIPLWIQIVFTLFMWFLVGSLLALGFKQSAPRWFMPYLGVPLSLISLIAFNNMVNPEWNGFPFLHNASWFVTQVFYLGMLWMGLIVSILLIFLLTGLIPRLRPFHQRLRDDWTLLPFTLYGAVPFVIVLSFDEFKNEEMYLILAFLALALGAWLYFRSASAWRKFWSLLGGLTLAMAVAFLGQALLYESSFPSTVFPRWNTTMSTFIMWMWMALFMFISAGLNLLPHSNEQPKEA
ncbi:MAG: hypothetical protein IT314_16180 [Anaerolineales bacterium]|nr:hypothetical protein [Anaerolineales bacterium]